jgi:sec-independent protein translocase protein TatA
MFGIGMPELMIILVILVLIVGPGKLPQLGSALGGAIRGFRKAADGEPATIEGEQQKKPRTDL